MWEIRAQFSHYLKVWSPCACSTPALPSWSPHLESRLQSSCCLQVCFPHASSSCPGSRYSCASKQASGLMCYLQTWVPHTCSRCCVSWKPMPQCKWTPGSLLPCGHQTIKACWLCCPTGTLSLLLSARRLPPHIQVNLRLQALIFLAAGGFPPHRAWKPTTPHCP
jgi:hypothetical protein